jgi:hypothetical protein
MTISLIAKWSRWLVLLCVVLAGCSGGEGRTLALDQDAAREACKEFLNAWKSGEKSDDLQPAIIGKDEDWSAGAKLLEYELLPNEMDGGSNLHIPVRLTLKNAQGSESKLDVTYIVGTSPKVTVFRD